MCQYKRATKTNYHIVERHTVVVECWICKATIFLCKAIEYDLPKNFYGKDKKGYIMTCGRCYMVLTDTRDYK